MINKFFHNENQQFAVIYGRGLIDIHVHMATDPTNVDNRASTLSVVSRILCKGNGFFRY